jgi:ABC-type multidrug transport system ATPase subunit
VLVCSHDIAELEPLIDHVGFLDDGRLLLSESMETLRSRFRWVEALMPAGTSVEPADLPAEWLSVEQSGNRLRFLDSAADEAGEDAWSRCLPAGARIEAGPATLRDVFLAFANRDANATSFAMGRSRVSTASLSGTRG